MTTNISAANRKLAATAALALTAGIFVPAAAQPTERSSPSGQQYQQPAADDNLRTVAGTLNAQRGEAFRQRNSSAVAEFYAPDAVYVELLPRAQVMRGRGEIRRHFDELLAAQTSDLSPTVVSAEMTGSDGMSVAGDYVLTTKENRKIIGHFFQVLRRDGGAWKIALHVFARPDPVTVGEVDLIAGTERTRRTRAALVCRG